MKVLRIIILITIPLFLLLYVLGIIFSLQHWPVHGIVKTALGLDLLVCLVSSFIFALRYKP